MGQPYVGEIRLVGFNFAPQGWQFCDGSLYSIAEFSTLFSLIGTTYGGDGQSTFGVPNLLGRVPVHMGSGFVIGQIAGTETVTVTTTQIPSHNHALQASTTGASSNVPTGAVLATSSVDVYIAPTTIVATTGVSTLTGESQPHDNLQPYLCLNFIISFFGVYPSQ